MLGTQLFLGIYEQLSDGGIAFIHIPALAIGTLTNIAEARRFLYHGDTFLGCDRAIRIADSCIRAIHFWGCDRKNNIYDKMAFFATQCDL